MKNMLKFTLFALFIPTTVQCFTPEQVIAWYTKECESISDTKEQTHLEENQTETNFSTERDSTTTAQLTSDPNEKSKKTRKEKCALKTADHNAPYECPYQDQANDKQLCS